MRELMRDATVRVHTVSRGELDLGAEHEHHRRDLLDRQQSRALIQTLKPDVILHIAWYAEHGKFWNAAENLDWVGATLELVRALHAAGGTRFVGVGSCAEYAWGGDENLSEAASALEPSTLYGVAKDATRRVLESFAESTDLDWAWARLFLMYGGGEARTRLFPSIALPLLRGENAQSSAGDQLRDFLHVDDVARGIVLVALSDVKGPINVASGEGLSVGDFAAEVARATGSEARLERGALPMRAGEPPRIVADVRRLRALGFEPQDDLAAGVARALHDLR